MLSGVWVLSGGRGVNFVFLRLYWRYFYFHYTSRLARWGGAVEATGIVLIRGFLLLSANKRKFCKKAAQPLNTCLLL